MHNNDVLSLRDGTYLNDTVLDAFFLAMNMVTPANHVFFTTGCVTTLRQRYQSPDPPPSTSITRIFAPINLHTTAAYFPAHVNGNHWILIVYTKHNNLMTVFDSLHLSPSQDMSTLYTLLQTALLTAQVCNICPTLTIAPWALQQPNMYDCGVYTCNAALSTYTNNMNTHNMTLHLSRVFLRQMLRMCM
jgi:Ulp1 family protease